MLEPLQEVHHMLRPHVRFAVRGCAAVLGFSLLALAAPWMVDTNGLPPSLDGAWMMSLTEAAVQGEISGRDTYATYGWAFQRIGLWARDLHNDRSSYDSIPLFAVLLSVLGAAALVAALLLVRSLDAAGIVFACAAVAALNLGQAAWLRAACLVLVAALAARVLARPSNRWFRPRLIGVTIFGASLQSLSFDLGVYSVLTITGAVILLAVVAPRERAIRPLQSAGERVRETALRALIVLATAGITFGMVSLLLSAGEPAPFDYLSVLAELSSGYASTMGYPWQGGPVWTWALAALAVFVTVGAAFDLRRGDEIVRCEAAALLCAALLFARGGTTRSDVGHITLAAIPLFVAFLVLALRSGQRLRRRLSAAAVFIALCATWPGASFHRLALAAQAVATPTALTRRVSELRSFAASRSVTLPAPLSGSQSTALVVFPYLNQFAHLTGRRLIAPFVQTYQATTARLDRRYAQSIAADPRAQEVLYGIDDVGVGRIDGVFAVTRNPAIFSELFRDFRPAGPAADGYLLLRRAATPREFPAAALSFTPVAGGIALAAPAECSLLRVRFRADYPAARALGRPSPWRATIQHGAQTLAVSHVVPLDRTEFTTLLPVGPPTEVAAVLAGDAPRHAWDRMTFEPVDRSLFSFAPRSIVVVALECLTP